MKEGELFQLHWQFADRTEFTSQNNIHSKAEMREWVAGVQKRFSLPDGAEWMMCNEKSEDFLMAVTDEM